MTENPFSLLTTDGFIAAFEKTMREVPTKQAAFDLVNKEHLRLFKKLKYSNYDSFRQVRNKKMKNKS